MISTPLSLLLDKPLPPQGGRAQAGDATATRDFADMMSRLFFSNMPVAALARAAELPDAMMPLPDDRQIEPERKPEVTDRTDRISDRRSRDKEAATALEGREASLPTPEAAHGSDVWPPPDGDAVPPTSTFPPQQPQSQPQPVLSAGTPPAQQPADRPLAQSVAAAVQSKDAEILQAAPHPARQAQPGADILRAQVIDGGATNQPPPLGHMLSGRAAVVAQSGDGSAAPLKDAAAMLKGGAAEQPAAALFGGATQATSAAAQKAKGQSKPASPGATTQTAGTAQASQASGAQAAQAAVPAQAAVQAGFDGALATTSNASGQPGTLAPQAPRGEPLPLAGSGGQQAPQATFRAPETAASKPRMPLPPRFVADQVAVQIQKSLSQGNDRINIQLKPAELGKVEVRLDVGHEGRVTAVITADRADTLDLLQRDARILQHSLQDAGLRADSNSLSFELRSQGQAFDDTRSGTGNRGGFEDAGTDDGMLIDRAAPRLRPDIVTNDRVDIQV
jgi:flagellar hook-length control protein FliK